MYHQKLSPTYVKRQDELSAHEGALFKGNTSIIPADLHRETIQKIYEGHLGVESCLRRARGREAFNWPLMTSQIKDYVSNFHIM